MRLKIVLLFLASILIMQFSLFAQEKLFEITPFVGYSFSEGVNTGADFIVGIGRVYAVDAASGLSWGVQFDVLASENFSIGFLYGNQESGLIAKLVEPYEDREFADLDIKNYLGVFTFTMGEADEELRPFFFGGLGATSYSPGDVRGISTQGFTKFSTTWGGGAKYRLSKYVGLRFTGRWTPTYIRSTPDGLWCGWYGCWIVEQADFSNQFEFSLGLSLGF